MAASNWTVAVFGDSWAQYMHPTWPQVLGGRLGARVQNFAAGGAVAHDLAGQCNMCAASPHIPKGAQGLFCPELLVVVHTGGNDFIMKMAEVLMGGGGGGLLGGLMGGPVAAPTVQGTVPEILKANPGMREATLVMQFLETMYRLGARHFLVSGVPAFLQMPIFNLLWPVVGNLVKQGKLEDLGIGPEDGPVLAMEVQAAAILDRWMDLVQDFSKSHTDATCCLFDEVGALERLREALGPANFDRAMWDFTMFHPSPYGHQQIAAEAHRVVAENFPVLSQLAPHPSVPVTPGGTGKTPAEPTPPAAAPVPAETTAPAPTEKASPSPQSMTLHFKNVKGDVTFSVKCDDQWKVPQLRAAVVAASPEGFAAPGMDCFLAHKAKFLEDGPQTLGDLAIADNSQIFVVMKLPQKKA